MRSSSGKRCLYALVGVVVMLIAGFVYAWSILSAPIAADFPAWTTRSSSQNFWNRSRSSGWITRRAMRMTMELMLPPGVSVQTTPHLFSLLSHVCTIYNIVFPNISFLVFY